MGYANNSKTHSSARVTERASRSGCSVPSFLSLMQNEKVLTVAHPSWMNFLWFVIFGVLLIPLFFIGVVLLLYALINVKTTSLVVTDRRVVMKTGWLSQSISEVRIGDIRGVNLQQTIWQRIVGTGTIIVGTAATGGAEIVMVGVNNPHAIISCINASRQ